MTENSMTESPLPIEYQLKRYADAIDPASTRVPATRTSPSWFGSSQSAWLAAAAVLLVAFGVVLWQRGPSGQQVDTGAFAAQPAETPAPPPPVVRDWLSREEQLVVFMAELTLLDECLVAGGGERYGLPTESEFIAHFGSWQPNGILGIGAEGAARTIGYSDAGWGGQGSPSQAAVFDSGEQRYAAIQQCWVGVDAAIGDKTRNVELWNQLIGSDGTQGERFRDDPELAAAIVAWQDCVRDAVGIDADTPNELARRYAFDASGSTQAARDVAVADVRCQDDADLVETFHRARVTQLRIELGDQAVLLDERAQIAQSRLARARQVLDDRGIKPPSLD